MEIIFVILKSAVTGQTAAWEEKWWWQYNSIITQKSLINCGPDQEIPSYWHFI